MQFIQQSFAVSFSYKVFFTENILAPDNDLFIRFFQEIPGDTSNKKILFAVDEGVWKSHPRLEQEIQNYFASNQHTPQLIGEVLVVKGGEETKNDESQVNIILEAINKHRIDRHSFLAVIGGGAVLDMAGYAAAIAHRGIKLIRIPTTVLSQNDSGVGVKNSLNYFNKKNFLGTFSPPVAVINDAAFLRTLDDRNWRSGISEAVKVALIKDQSFFYWMEENIAALNERDAAAMNELIIVCARLHMEHIAGADPFEMGSSRPLDFGHWSAHKMEQLTHYELLHGEAVAIGIALDSIYSSLMGYLPEDAMHRILSMLKGLGFPLADPVLMQADKILDGLEEFKEHLGGQLTITLLSNIGTGFSVHEVDREKMKQAFQMLLANK